MKYFCCIKGALVGVSLYSNRSAEAKCLLALQIHGPEFESRKPHKMTGVVVTQNVTLLELLEGSGAQRSPLSPVGTDRGRGWAILILSLHLLSVGKQITSPLQGSFRKEVHLHD